MAGPLAGVKIIELAGIGPGPFCGMMLSDMGAELLRIDRANAAGGSFPDGPRADILGRGRRSVAVDLKSPAGIETVLRLVEKADVLYEGFRPGVTERLGLGPETCLERNPRLVYGRMTGWGQEGPLAHAAGHDINYIALAGALHAIGRKGENPVPPLNLVGDFGGGGMLLAFGIVCALVERDRSGQGQVVDAAMVDGAAALMAIIFGAHSSGWWHDERGVNMLDTGAHFYETYETSDGKYISVGSIEPQFYQLLLEHSGLATEDLPNQNDRSHWPEMKERLAAIFRSRTRDEWCEVMEGTDICFAPVLTLSEAPEHPHAVARNAFRNIEGVVQPGPAPRFSRTAPDLDRPPAFPGEHTEETLSDWGFSEAEISKLREEKAIA
ncbi:MAG: CaiB/BaiF CoA-transferase family protein [Myxococcota bacterium]|nr:CaiB/BaiF CoA-transferase family protein [Myxococcota bacterium]